MYNYVETYTCERGKEKDIERKRVRERERRGKRARKKNPVQVAPVHKTHAFLSLISRVSESMGVSVDACCFLSSSLNSDTKCHVYE